jgi:hypothetical protein
VLPGCNKHGSVCFKNTLYTPSYLFIISHLTIPLRQSPFRISAHGVRVTLLLNSTNKTRILIPQLRLPSAVLKYYRFYCKIHIYIYTYIYICIYIILSTKCVDIAMNSILLLTDCAVCTDDGPSVERNIWLLIINRIGFERLINAVLNFGNFLDLK